MLQGGYLDVNRGSANRNGWNCIIGSFVISKLTDSVKLMGKSIMRYDGATNTCGRGIYRNYGRKYSKEKLHSQDIFSNRRTQHNRR